jgi:hypothetical protein
MSSAPSLRGLSRQREADARARPGLARFCMARQLKRPRHPQANLDAETSLRLRRLRGGQRGLPAEADACCRLLFARRASRRATDLGERGLGHAQPVRPAPAWTALAAPAFAAAGVVGISNRHGKQQEQAKNEDDSGTYRHLPHHVHSPTENVHVLFSQGKTPRLYPRRTCSLALPSNPTNPAIRVARGLIGCASTSDIGGNVPRALRGIARPSRTTGNGFSEFRASWGLLAGRRQTA